MMINGINVRVFEPKNAPTNSPGLLYIHGGGFTILNVDVYHEDLMYYAKATGSVVLAPAYRKSPEHPFPVPFEDCLSVARYFRQNSKMFGVDKEKIVIAGDSAGGNLAAAIMQHLSEEDDDELPPLAGAVLIYPMVQAISFNLPSYRERDAPLVPREDLIRYFTFYAGIDSKWMPHLSNDEHICREMYGHPLLKYVDYMHLPKRYLKGYKYEQKRCNQELHDLLKVFLLDSRAFPLMANDVSRLSPTLLILAEQDELRDEGILYHKRLLDAGVDVTLKIYKQAIHPFMHGHTGALCCPEQLARGRQDFLDFVKRVTYT